MARKRGATPANSSSDSTSPNLFVTDACLEDLKPKLLELARFKGTGASMAEVRAFTHDHIIPIWLQHKMDELELHPELYHASMTPKAARERFLAQVRAQAQLQKRWLKKYVHASDHPTANTSETSAASTNIAKRRQSARELFADSIKDELDRKVEDALESQDVDDKRTARLSQRNLILTSCWQALTQQERQNFEAQAQASVHRHLLSPKDKLVDKIGDLLLKASATGTSLAVFHLVSFDAEKNTIHTSRMSALAGAAYPIWADGILSDTHNSALLKMCNVVLPRPFHPTHSTLQHTLTFNLAVQHSKRLPVSPASGEAEGEVNPRRSPEQEDQPTDENLSNGPRTTPEPVPPRTNASPAPSQLANDHASPGPDEDGPRTTPEPPRTNASPTPSQLANDHASPGPDEDGPRTTPEPPRTNASKS
ncbi:hypothetical protein EXIGLDRAFT_693457, partial [Exidia glandulosa HHB12029]